MRTLRRLKFMSSPSLSDLGKREPAAAADERGTQQRRACANATWNSIHNGVIAVFQRKGLPDQELFSLNEGVRGRTGTSLVGQWLRIRLPTQGTRVRALAREDPTCRGATKPVCHNY
uniref:Proline rich 5 n=1 Tax=Balaenoptera musculus TaxID=9771 RepID=A0A8C0DTV1_BALMU